MVMKKCIEKPSQILLNNPKPILGTQICPNLVDMTPYQEENIIVPRFNEESGFYTTKSRSKIMSKIRSKNTKPELLLRKGDTAQQLVVV